MTRHAVGLALGVALSVAFTAFAVAQKDKDKKEESESGDWTVEGDKIKLKGAKDEVTCKFDSAKIECENEKEKGKPGLTFKKQ